MQRYTDFYNAVLDMYEVPPFDGHTLSMKQNSTLRYFLREYMHLPCKVIAELLGEEAFNTRMQLNRMQERANDKAVPVSMQNRYRETLEELDDLARDMGFAPRPLGNQTPERQMELLWNRAKEIGRPGAYDGEDEVQADVETLVYKVRAFDSEEAAVAFVRREYIIHQA